MQRDEASRRACRSTLLMTMAEKDYYKVLGVATDASQEEIRKAYRRLAKKHHPDRHGGSKEAENRFKRITEAHEVLGNEKKRRQYDQLREAGRRGFFGGGEGMEDIFGTGRKAGRGGGKRTFTYEDLGSLGDLFSKVFGREEPIWQTETGRRAEARGRDIRTRISVPFDTAVKGGRAEVRVPRKQTCARCNGTGASPGGRADTCPQCGGSGQVVSGQGGFSFSRPCPQCFGRGKIIRTPCAVCDGSGFAEEQARVEVEIPKGISDGKKIRLRGMGQPSGDGVGSGDLIIEVHVEDDPRFKREGLDVYSEATIDMVQAALGTEVNVQTLKGLVNLKVPAGTQPDRKLRIRGHGVEDHDGKRGDHFVRIKVRIPENLSDRQKKLLKEFRQSSLRPDGVTP